jgi:AcrR family transcriptional regulator
MSTPRQEVGKRRRLPPEERRRQLVAIGLQELATRPIHALSIDRVADIAGISRSLLFRYFPTKQDYYVAIVGSASRRLLRAAVPAPGDPDPLRAILQAFVSFIDRHGDNYQTFFHGGYGSDPQIREIHGSMKNTLVDRVISALGCADGSLTRMRLRGWWSLVESLAIDRLHEPGLSVDDVVDYVSTLLPSVLTPDDEVTTPESGS